MKRIFALATIILFFLSTLFAGCVALDDAHRVLIEHPRKVVSYPAKVGKTAGIVVGIPVFIVLAIPSLLVANALPIDDEAKAWSGLYPFVATYDLGTIIGGGIPWCVVGWKDLPEQETEQIEASPCDDLDRSLTDARKKELAPVIAKQLYVESAEIIGSYSYNGWLILSVRTNKSNVPFLFYNGDPVSNSYLVLWSGAAKFYEEQAINNWVVENAQGIPPKLASCFASQVSSH